MKQFYTVFKFYLLTGVRAKGFIITLAFMSLAVIGLCLFSKFSETEVRNFAVINKSSTYNVDDTKMNELLDDAHFTLYDSNQLANLRNQVKENEIDGLFIVQEKEGKPTIEQVFNTFSEGDVLTLLMNDLKSQQLEKVIKKEKLDPNLLSDILSPVDIKEDVVKDASKTFGVVYVFVFLMYFFILIYGQSLGVSVASEKNTRVMEIMLSKVKPLIMLYGKMAAVFSMAVIQLSSMLVVFGFCVLIDIVPADKLEFFGEEAIDLSAITPSVILLFLVYFLLGFMIYGLLYAAAGAMVSRIEDLTAVAAPIMMFVIAGFFISMQSLMNPSGTLVEVSSYFPLFSSIVTFSRIAAGEAKLLEIVITIGLQVLTILVLGHFVKRIYVNGVMVYTEKFSWKQIKQFASKN